MQIDEGFYASLRKVHRIRQFAMEQRKRSDSALGALLREALGWHKGLPKDDRDAIADQAKSLIDTGEKLLKWQSRLEKNPSSKAKPPEGIDDPTFVEWQDVILSALAARLPMTKTEDAALARMLDLAESLPVAEWFRANVFEELKQLAVVIAETGDLGSYATVSKLWKRMGVAVMNGVRQGGLTKSAPKAEWIAHGYVRRRRSLLFVIGDVLIKQNDHYRAIYAAEKERQRSIAEGKGLQVVPSAKIPKARASEFMSDGHVHNRARRYMEKQFLADLWSEWRRAGSGLDITDGDMPASEESAQAGNGANSVLKPSKRVPRSEVSAQAEGEASACSLQAS